MPDIFTKSASLSPGFNSSLYKIDRLNILDTETAKGLNTYRNWGTFGAPIDKIFDNATNQERELTNMSVKSLFNPISSVGYNQYIQVRSNAPLLDYPKQREEMRMTSDCSIKSLVSASEKNMLGRAIYNYSDFMYCTHLGKLSNNYMITLRRFAFPAGDHINYTDPFSDKGSSGMGTERHPHDIGRLITWMGTPGNEMSNILKWNVKMPFKEMKSDFQEAGDAGGDSGGPLGTFLNATTNSKYQEQMVKGYAGSSTFSYMSGLTDSKFLSNVFKQGGDPPYSSLAGWHDDNNKVYGPLDVIIDTHIRDRGLEFTQEISLVFDYTLRSYDGINPRAAFLDLLANILTVTYTNGPFWGGAYRGTGASQSNVFANLPIFQLDANSSFPEVVDAGSQSFSSIISNMDGNTGNLGTSIKNVVNSIGKGLFSSLLGAGLNALGRPHKAVVNSLLSPAPVGFWHLTIGNPWHPIMQIGNLILDGTEIEQYGPLGLDDFPTGLRVTVKLKHGKSRDATLIEQMFTMGESRIYTSVGKDVLNMYDKADRVSSKKKGKSSKEYIPTTKLGALANAGMNYGKNKLFNTIDWAADNINSAIAKSKKEGKLLYRHFGTKDKQMIVNVSKEGAYGQQKNKKKTEETKKR